MTSVLALIDHKSASDAVAEYTAAVDRARELPMPVEIGDMWVPSPVYERPTESDLSTATDAVIAFENAINTANDALDSIAVMRTEVFARYYAAHAAAEMEGFDRLLATLNGTQNSTVDLLDELYSAWSGHRMECQSWLSVWTTARAKIEHDLEWQRYVADGKSGRPRIEVKAA